MKSLNNKKIIFISVVLILCGLLFFAMKYFMKENEKICETHEKLFERLFKEGFKTKRLIANKISNDDILILSEYLLDKSVTAHIDPSLNEGFSTK